MGTLDDDTQDVSAGTTASEGPAALVLTIAWHPEIDRVGEQAVIGARAAVGRKEPDFSKGPLGERAVSRAPFSLSVVQGGARVRRGEHASDVEIDGTPLESERMIADADLARGVVLELAHRVVLVLRRTRPAQEIDALGLVGASAEVAELRAQIRRVGDLDVSVLLTGESGSGKEVAARAIVAASPRRERAFVALNVAATPPSMAASELFGHVRGAFTGAERARAGLFVEADGGTLFLDEIGDTPPEVQVTLLRALETGEVRPVGGSETRRVDVRVISATDVDLEGAAERGSFREALVHRLAGYRILVPPLRERREDIGPCFARFAAQELERMSLAHLLVPSDKPWMPSGLVARLVRQAWPGNVRQLRNAARQLVISSRDRDRAHLDAVLERSLEPDALHSASRPAPGLPEADVELVAILRKHRFELRRAARELGVSRSTLYARIDKSPLLRKARDLSIEEIEAARASGGGDLETMAGALEVSPRGLKLRMRELGLD